MPKLTAEQKAQRAAKAKATRAANAAAAAAEKQKAAAPIETDAKPAELTRSARHAELLDAARKAGADETQLRGRITYAVATSGPKAQRKTAPDANYSTRYASVTEQTQRFVSKLHRAYGFEPFDCEPHDAGKLARALGNGLIETVSGHHTTTTKTGLPAIGPVSGQPMLFRVTKPDCDFTF